MADYLAAAAQSLRDATKQADASMNSHADKARLHLAIARTYAALAAIDKGLPTAMALANPDEVDGDG
jgi:hypothetical protein